MFFPQLAQTGLAFPLPSNCAGMSRAARLTHCRIPFDPSDTVRSLLLGAVACIVFVGFGLPDLGFFTAAILLIPAKVISRPRILGQGAESPVSEALNALASDYIVLNQVMLPGTKGTVDYLVIGANGVFAIDTKKYAGYVKCDQEQWFVNGQRMRSFSKEAKRNSMAVRSSIATLFTATPGSIPRVAPLVVFTSPLVKIRLFKPTVFVLRARDLAGFIRDYDSKRVLTEEEKWVIVQHLQSLQPTFRELGDYPAITEDRLYGVT
jgi:hypothetical protein